MKRLPNGSGLLIGHRKTENSRGKSIDSAVVFNVSINNAQKIFLPGLAIAISG